MSTNLLLFFSTLQMLTNIENRLEELFEMIEMMPQEKVEAAEKVNYYLGIPYHVKYISGNTKGNLFKARYLLFLTDF